MKNNLSNISIFPITIDGNEIESMDLSLPDGGLKPLIGVYNIQVFRSCRTKPELSDGDGWTYAHHPDIACWKGRLYAAWAMTPKNEDEPPYKLVYSTSTDGINWSFPQDFFPREYAWPCRFYFYRSSNGRMLAFSAAKTRKGTVNEESKKILLVREIQNDHSLGKVYTLINYTAGCPPSFHASNNNEFIIACSEAAENNLLLEQQDYGCFLGKKRMKWHDNPSKCLGWPFGKAFCFYRRKDDVIVGLCKMGFVTLSYDNGKTWSHPVIPPTLTAGSGKIWGQKTSDNRYILAYNPDPQKEKRYPLVIVHGDDGCKFHDMRVIHGEFPPLRYSGSHKDPGIQYMRGLTTWTDDGSFTDKNSVWIIYSVHKEDIWVSRIQLPIKTDETNLPENHVDKATGNFLHDWNIYSPLWCPVRMTSENGIKCIKLSHADPWDYSCAFRVLPQLQEIKISFQVKAKQTNGHLDIEFWGSNGKCAVRMTLANNGLIKAIDGNVLREILAYEADKWLAIILTVNIKSNQYMLRINNGTEHIFQTADKNCTDIQKFVFRTAHLRRSLVTNGVNPTTDIPLSTLNVFFITTPSFQSNLF